MNNWTGACGANVEQDRHVAAEAQVLVADVELEHSLTFAGLAGVDQGERVLDVEAAQLVSQRIGGQHLHIQEAVLEVDFVDFAGRTPVIDAQRLRAFYLERLGDRGFVDDFDEHGRVAGLLKSRHRRSALRLDARFGIDVHHNEDVGVEHFLNLGRVLGFEDRRNVCVISGGRGVPSDSKAWSTRDTLLASG